MAVSDPVLLDALVGDLIAAGYTEREARSRLRVFACRPCECGGMCDKCRQTERESGIGHGGSPGASAAPVAAPETLTRGVPALSVCLCDPDTDAVTTLQRVHKRLGCGVDIATFVDGTVEIRWRREYPEWGTSDERWLGGFTSIQKALKAVLEYEDEQDRIEADA